MNTDDHSVVLNLESRLASAMLESNIEALEQLLSDELIFTNHLGGVMTKSDDIGAHKSGILKIENIQLSTPVIRVFNDYALVNVIAEIKGSFNGQADESRFRFSRVWGKSPDGSWRLKLGHSTLIAEG